MDLAVVSAAQRDRELVADLAPQGGVLRKPQMMSIRRLATTDETRLLGDVSNVVAVADPAWLRQGEGAFVDPAWDPLSS